MYIYNANILSAHFHEYIILYKSYWLCWDFFTSFNGKLFFFEKNYWKQLIFIYLFHLKNNLVRSRKNLFISRKGCGGNMSKVWIWKYLFHGSQLLVFQQYLKYKYIGYFFYIWLLKMDVLFWNILPSTAISVSFHTISLHHASVFWAVPSNPQVHFITYLENQIMPVYLTLEKNPFSLCPPALQPS